jgi:hypothetical protein
MDSIRKVFTARTFVLKTYSHTCADTTEHIATTGMTNEIKENDASSIMRGSNGASRHVGK